MSDFNILTKKIQILINSSDKDEKNLHYGNIRFMADECVKACNFVVQQQHMNLHIKERIKLYNPEIESQYNLIETEISELEKEFRITKDKNRKSEIKKRKSELFTQKKDLDNSLIEYEKDFYVKSGTTSKGDNAPVQNSTYQLLAKKFKHLSSYIRTSINDNVFKNLKKDRKDVLSGKKSVRSYRSKIIFFSKHAIRNLKFNPISKEFEFNFLEMPMMTKLGRDKSNNMLTLARVVNGEYLIGDSSIIVEDKKIFLSLVVKAPKNQEQNPILDPNICVGVDLGISVPIFLTSTNDKWGIQIGNKKALFGKKVSFRKQRQAVQKVASQSNGGHGYKTKMGKWNDLRKAESNYTKTLFHTYAKQVVEYAIKHNAGTIKLENLKNIGENDKKMKSLVNLWGPRSLQNLIEEKANKIGIQVFYVDPKFTSQTCSHCDHYEENQRDQRDYFICKNSKCKQHNKKQHADRNASFNIAKSIKFDNSQNDNEINNEKVQENFVS